MSFFSGRLFLLAISSALVLAAEAPPNVQEIIRQSVVANQADFDAAPQFEWKETDRDQKGSKTFQVPMIQGTPYNRLIAINGHSLSEAQNASEMEKLRRVTDERNSESSEKRRSRINKFDEDRLRDHEMMEQLVAAFTFTLIGRERLNGFSVWVLKATPRPDYKPPNIRTQVLRGMRGQLWIDQKTHNWVKVTAQVIRPVSIEGFLAEVQPGTRFEMEKTPVGNGIWQIAHFSMSSNAEILHIFSHASQEDDRYFDYRRIAMAAAP